MKLLLDRYLSEVRRRKPLVHHITNYVTANDCANITLAIGGSPVMADDPAEAADMTALADALVINMGTLNARTVGSMILAGKRANEKGIPVVFDPVGCGGVPFRTEAAERILEAVKVSAIRGNISEVGALCGEITHTKGVDAADRDEAENRVALAKAAAERFHCTAAVTGAMDVVSDGRKTLAIENGCPAMARVTGCGCMCSSLTGAFCGGNPDYIFESVAAAVICMGLCGEISWTYGEQRGLGTFHMGLFDAAGNLMGRELLEGAKYHEL